MTQTNEIMLLKALARKHLGDSNFCRKYGLSCGKESEILLAPYAATNEQNPPQELLEKVNESFELEFCSAVQEKMKNIVSQDFINDLISGINY